MDNDTQETIMLIATLIFIGVIAMIIFNQWNKSACYRKYEDFEKRYDLYTGCQIRVNDKWIPAESYYVKEE